MPAFGWKNADGLLPSARGGRPARQPGQIVLEFEVPLRAIRSTLEHDVERLRTRKGAGRLEKRRGVLGNQPVFAGTRVRPVAVSMAIAAGWSDTRILKEYLGEQIHRDP